MIDVSHLDSIMVQLAKYYIHSTNLLQYGHCYLSSDHKQSN